MAEPDLDLLCVNTIRGLCMDAVQKANSGHPGTPMGMAPVAYTLWQRYPALRSRRPDLAQPGPLRAVRRPRLHAVVVPAPPGPGAGRRPRLRGNRPPCRGHGRPGDISPARFALPGPSRIPLTSGVEATTGPLGQGVATSVGMAIAAEWLATRYNQGEFTLFDFNVYALAGDGCMMEGISGEAASLAGHLGLSNLCWIYDSNRVTIEGHTDIAFTEDVAARFLAYDGTSPPWRTPTTSMRSPGACTSSDPSTSAPP